jgi:hypothetical protein
MLRPIIGIIVLTMSEGETRLLSIVESLLAKVLVTAVAEQFNGLRAEIAALKQEFVASAAANLQKQEECQSAIVALSSLLPGSHPSTQNSGTTISAAAEFRAQPIPDADYAAYWNPAYPDDGAPGFMGDNLGSFSDGDDWTHRAETFEASSLSSLESKTSSLPLLPVPQLGCAGSSEVVTQQPGTTNELPQAALPGLTLYPHLRSSPSTLQPSHPSTSAFQPPPSLWLSDRRSPALHRKHNPKSCMVCRGSFRKLSGCKEHMLKCLKPNSGCRFMPNYDHHMQLIRPFSGPDVETRWGCAISEWIHRKE